MPGSESAARCISHGFWCEASGCTTTEAATAVRRMPVQKPGASKQDYTTPPEFVAACVKRFGPIGFDLAATAENRVVPDHFGPGSEHNDNGLGLLWRELNGVLWLNPPFGNIAAWAAACALESQQGAEILFLVPASVGANWFWDHVAPYAICYQIGRLAFGGQAEGKSQPFPKDLMLCHYGAEGGMTPKDRGYDRGSADVRRWQWKAA